MCGTSCVQNGPKAIAAAARDMRDPVHSLSSGLYRRPRSSTGSADPAIGRRSRAVTAGGEFHPARERGLYRSPPGNDKGPGAIVPPDQRTNTERMSRVRKYPMPAARHRAGGAITSSRNRHRPADRRR